MKIIEHECRAMMAATIFAGAVGQEAVVGVNTDHHYDAAVSATDRLLEKLGYAVQLPERHKICGWFEEPKGSANLYMCQLEPGHSGDHSTDFPAKRD